MTRDLQPCGTRAAYARHITHGQPPCDPCSAANAQRGQRQRDDKRLAPSRRAVLAEAVGHGSYGGIAGGS